MTEIIKVFQADDHAIVREGMRLLLMGEPDIELIGEASDGQKAILALKKMGIKPDVLLLDLQMPQMGGIEAIETVKEIETLAEMKILIITSFGDDDHLFPAIRAGAIGYLLKDSAPQEIIRAIRAVHAGQTVMHPSIAARILQEINKPKKKGEKLASQPLTTREVDVLRRVAQGLTNIAIAEQMFLSERTVRTHVSNILGKLHLANRTQAALYALREGLASLD